MADSPVITLEVLNGVTVQLVESMEPWTLAINALVVAVGPNGFGGLGQAMFQRLPAALPGDIAFSTITPERPLWVDLPARFKASSSLQLESVILATAHDARGKMTVSPSSPPTIKAAATGLLNAFLLADQHSTPWVGAILPGTGMLGLDAREVIAATVPQVRHLIVSGQVRWLERIVLIAGEPSARLAIADAWRSFSPSLEPSLTQLTAVVAAALPNVFLSGTAGVVLANALAVPMQFRPYPESDFRLVGEELLDVALKYPAEHRRPDVATALLDKLATARLVHDATEPFPGIGSVLSRIDSPAPVKWSHEPTDALPLVELAAQLAARTIGQQDVHQRHLLAAAVLARPIVDPVLEALGVDDAGLRRCLRAAIAEVVPTEAPSAWDEILLGGAAPASPADYVPASEEYSATVLAGGYSTDLVNPEEKISADRDLLGINTYVSMLASVIANKDTPLPLSIGLFGEWGSGKSFFMGRLRQQISELSTEEGYLARIEQIGFNAWHYADTNLWASLGDEIFRQLARPPDGEENAEAEERRKQLLLDLHKNMSQQRELEAATENAQQQAKDLRAQLDAAREKQGEAVTVLLRSVAASDSFNKRLSTAWTQLGVNDEVEQGELLARQIRGVAQDVNTFRRATSGRRGFILAAFAIVSVLALTIATVFSDTVHHWLIGTGLLGLTGGLIALTTFMVRVSSGAQLLAKVATEAREKKDALVTQKVQTQVDALNQAEAEADILATQLAEVQARAGEIGRQLADLAPGRRFYGFVADRAASQDYRGKLGLISIIRRDFEKLIELMQDWRDHPEEHGNHQPIDRIVLYIDDLDRCSPDQVVEVLQAVHLLLALDLFVVVVGVDPRWLLHSLEQRYRDNFALDTAAADRTDDGQPSGWDATALNYLEKIFNIPFVLPGMTTDSFAALISGWSAGSVPTSAQRGVGEIKSPSEDGVALPDAAAPTEDAQPKATVPTTPNELATSTAVPESPAAIGVAADVPVEAGSAVDQISRGQRLAPRPLSAQEITHLQALAPLVQSPREAKRVFNLYRTLRASGNLSPASAFLGDEQTPGEFQAVIVLLGLLTAEPRLVGDLLFAPPDAGFAGGICHRPSSISWSSLLDGLAPRPSPANGWCNDLGELGEQPGRWEQVLPKLRQASAPVTLPDLAAFQKWGRLAARFSFILSPLAAGAADGSPVVQQPAPASTVPPA